MTTSLERTINDALTRFLIDQGVENVVRVTGFSEDSYLSGGCETCEYTVHEVDIYYDRITGGSYSYTYDGMFSDLIRGLTA